MNPYGSTAGAGSGEFHVYRHARQREMERIQQLSQDEQNKLKDEEFYDKIQKDKEEQEAKTAKKRKKRQRQKEAKQRKKNLALAGIGEQAPVNKDESKIVVEEIPNDGSFLERMKQKLAEESETKESETKESGVENEAEDECEEPPAKKQAT